MLNPNEADDTGFFKEKEPMKNRRQNFRCFTNFCLPSRCAPSKVEKISKNEKMFYRVQPNHVAYLRKSIKPEHLLTIAPPQKPLTAKRLQTLHFAGRFLRIKNCRMEN
ncbi:MAG: hypothetical protein EGQ92_05055 [Lactobacillus ruminis]|nr:hypothetical protein [Ligilactobacillus ruminis]